MALTGGPAVALRLLATMPFLDRLDLVLLAGWSRGTVYAAVAHLQDRGLVAAVPHAAPDIAATRRFHLTAAGLHRLAADAGRPVEALLHTHPVSAQWQRLLLQRLDALAAIYRVAATIAEVARPLRWQWHRAGPADAALTLPDGRTIAIVRQGRTVARTPFAKRLRRLRAGPLPSVVLVLAPDPVRLRAAGGLVAGAPTCTLLALERDTVAAGVTDPVWHVAGGGAGTVDLHTALAHTGPGGSPPAETPPKRATLPAALDATTQGDGAVADTPDHLLPVLLTPAEKRTLDLLGDWPWVTPPHVGTLLGVGPARCAQLLRRLQRRSLVAAVSVAGRRRQVLTDRGLALLARRDRTAVGAARQRWSATPLNPKAPVSWRNVTGTASRQLLRHLAHTTAVQWFAAVLAAQARSRGWDLIQFDPPRRAARYFRHYDRLHSVRPDAFGVLQEAGTTWPFFLEWERRAIRPTTMAARLAPYCRYYAAPRPTDDHGAPPAVLIVFDDDLAATRFRRVAREALARDRITVPLWVSHRRALAQVGPLGPAWRSPLSSVPAAAFIGPLARAAPGRTATKPGSAAREWWAGDEDLVRLLTEGAAER